MFKLSGLATLAAIAVTLGLSAPTTAHAQDPYVKLYNGYSGVFMVLDLGNRLNPENPLG